jgi:2,5-diamino-6-(ribosylamino)-4(3H)-pyrimidinone 5'-phosphate reductase
MTITARLLPLKDQPRPIIIDSNLRTPIDSKLLTNPQQDNPVNHPPIIFHSQQNYNQSAQHHPLTKAGATLIYLSQDDHGELSRFDEAKKEGPDFRRREKGHLPLDQVFDHLGALGYRSIMVEGGASVISSVLSSGLVDLLVVTIAPVLVGEGIGLFQNQVRLTLISSNKISSR